MARYKKSRLSRSRSTSRVRKFRTRSRSRSISRSRRSISARRSISRARRSNSRVRRSISRARRSLSRPRRSISRPMSSIPKSRRSRSRSRKSISRSRRSMSRSRRSVSRSSRSISRPRRSISRPRRSRSRSRYNKSRSRSKSKYKSTRSRSSSRLRKNRLSRTRSNSRSQKSRSNSKSRLKRQRLSRSSSNSRTRKSRSKSMSKSKYKKFRSDRSRSTSRKRKEKLSRSISPPRRSDNNELLSRIKKESDKKKKVPFKEKGDDDDDDLIEIPVAPATPPPVVDLASGSDEEDPKTEKQANSLKTSIINEDLRIPLNFSDKKSILPNVCGISSNLKFNEDKPLRAVSQISISNDLLMPLTFGRKQNQTLVPSTQHQTVDLTDNISDMGQKNKSIYDKEVPSVYDMEDVINVGDTTIDLNLAKTAFLDSAIKEKYGEKSSTAKKIEDVLGPVSDSLLPKNTTSLTPLKSNLDKPKVVSLESQPIQNIFKADEENKNFKQSTIGQCAAAYLREGEIVSTLRILYEMGGEMGIWQHSIASLYNQLLQLQNEGGDPRKYLNQTKDASDTLNLVKGHLESCLEDSKLGAVQRIVREELLHLISDIVGGKSSHRPVDFFTCYGIRTDVLACSMMDEEPEEIKEFIHNTLIYDGIYEPTEEIISTIFKAVEKSQKRFNLGQGV